jgi:hypothetical protein
MCDPDTKHGAVRVLHGQFLEIHSCWLVTRLHVVQWAVEEGYEDFEAAGPRGGRGFGPGGFGGRGGPLGPMGPPPLGRIGSGGGPMLDSHVVGPPLAGPAPGLMLVPAPGAGPLGPFIQVSSLMLVVAHDKYTGSSNWLSDFFSHGIRRLFSLLPAVRCFRAAL